MPDGREETGAVPLVVAVGAEHRDYQTLIDAVRGMDVQVRIAGASHWARDVAGFDNLPANVEFLVQPLGFAELRELYARAAAVAVPLVDVNNQFGVTTILEAMSMGLPVVTTANRGQRECIRGPLVGRGGGVDDETPQRGPQLFDGTRASTSPTGCYVPVADAPALRAALVLLTNPAGPGREYGRAARLSAERHFGFERYIETLAGLLAAEQPEPRAEAAPA
jgi:glycosyltransferase involved in cell wall biosynthesis